MSKRLELAGMTFGRLRVIDFAYMNKHRASCWHCICLCGKKLIVTGHKLICGWTKSCGCLSADTASAIWRKHGHTDRSLTGSPTPIYCRWQAMLQRCNNPHNQHYKNYGGRGIKVCKRWHFFQNFLADMGTPPLGMTLDRRDNDGDYCKKNCRWVTPREQQRNRRNMKLIEWRGQLKSLREWAEINGISYATLRYRFKHGWTVDEAFH